MQTQPVEDIKLIRNVETLWLAVLNGMAVIGELFLRRRMGIRHLNSVRFFAAMFLLVLISQASRNLLDLFVMYYFGYVVIFAWALHSLGQHYRFVRMDLEHSQYPGWPRLCDWSRHDERTAKKRIEPLLLMLFGIGIATSCLPLGMTFALSGIAIHIKEQQLHRHRRYDAQDMFDAEIFSSEVYGEYRNAKGARR